MGAAGKPNLGTRWMVRLLAAALLALLTPSSLADPMEDLRRTFRDPPPEYRPHAWWHWMSGEVTTAGMTKDLEAMKAAGIGGTTIFEIGIGTGHVFDTGKNRLFSEEWKALMRHAITEAERLGLEMGFHYSPGWSGSGGPWVPAEDSMKQVVHRSFEIVGGRRVAMNLAKPKHREGFYRDLALYAVRGHGLKRLSHKEASGEQEGHELARHLDTPEPGLDVLDHDEIVDLAEKLEGDRLEWEAPPGRWTLLRMGYTSNGRRNRVAREDYGSGLETDKFDEAAITKSFHAGVPGHLIKLEKELGSGGFRSITMDSWEVGYQNWSESLSAEFEERRGYSMDPHLPVLAGFVVESTELSRRFLWDFRRTCSELVADLFGATVRGLANRHGKKILIEPYREGPYHSFDYGMNADIVMSEFWKGGNMDRVKSVASIAHTRGSREHRAESFTTTYFNGGWRDHPWQYKRVGDAAFCSGLNSVTFHSSAHQPMPDRIVPGMSMGRWGAMVNRKQTWWPMAPAYMTYLARCQALLRPGDFVADVLFVTDEHLPKPSLEVHPELKAAGYDYDTVSPGFFLRNATVTGGKLHLPGGMVYGLVVLPQTKFVTSVLMEKIDATVRAGVPAIGFEYTRSPSLENYPQGDAVVRELGDRLLADARDGTLRNYFPNQDPLDVLTKLGIAPDFAAEVLPADATPDFIHHRLDGRDIYFVSNQAPKRIRGACHFRVGAGQPTLWDPVTGDVRDATLFTQREGTTRLQLELAPWQSLFVVFDPARESRPAFAALESTRPVQESEKPALEVTKVLRGAIFNALPERNTDITTAVRALQEGNRLVPGALPGQGRLMIMHYAIKGEQLFHFGQVSEPRVWLDAGDAEAIPLCARVELEGAGPRLVVSKPGQYTLKPPSGESVEVAVPPFEHSIALAGPWTVGFQENRGADRDPIRLERLSDLSTHDDFGVRHYSGILSYATSIEVPESFLDRNAGITLSFEKIANVASIEINGDDCGILWARPYAVEVSAALHPGRNQVLVQVANSWSNRLIGDEYFPQELERNGEGMLLERIPDWALEGRAEDRPVKQRVTFTSNRFYTKDDPLPPSGLIGKAELRRWIHVPVVRSPEAGER